MAGTSITDAFPAVPASALTQLLQDFDLAPSNSVADLLSLGVMASGALTVLAEYVIANTPDARLDQLVSAFHYDDQLTLQIRGFSARPANGLQRAGICTWQQLIAMTPADLLRLPAVGRKSVTEIIAAVLSRAAVQSLLGAGRHASDDAVSPGSRMERGEAKMPHEPDPAPAAGAKPNACGTAALPGLQILARWAVCIGRAATIGGALELAESQVLPDDVAKAVDALRQAPLQPQAGAEARMATAYEALRNACGDARRQGIFRRRISLQPPTLDELGANMQLTRERVRQLQKASEDSILAALLRPECSEIRWRATQLRQELGTAISASNLTVRSALETAGRGIPEEWAAETLMLWLAGPYRLDRQTGWLFAETDFSEGRVGPRSEVGPPPRSTVLEAVTDGGVVNIGAAKARAIAAGLVPAAVEDWIELCPFRDVDGNLVLWQGNVADKAAALLAILKRPATADELNRLIAEEHSVRGLRNRLLGDERFIRTDRHRIGLRQWALEEYSGIVDEIEEEIARRGGGADVDDLVKTLTKQFDLRASSVMGYTAAPRFVVEDGRIHVRGQDEPFMPTRTLFDEAHAFLLDEHRCSYRVRIDDELQRGSGRPLPQGVGAWLGVLPGIRREFHFRDDEVLLISWPDSALLGPALGSLRRQARARSAESGDFLLLEFDRASDAVEALLITAAELDAATGWTRGTLLTGIDAGDQQEFEQLLVKAVGASSATDLRKTCRERGDLELVELMRSERSPDLADALERLKKLL